MNIVINGFMDQRTWPIALKVLTTLRADSFVYTYNYYKPDFRGTNSKKTLLSWRKIHFYGDYDVDWNSLEPLGEELVDSMRGCEAVVLKMMDRLETLKGYSYRERKDLYLKHLRYWNDLFVRGKLDLMISSNVPHETSDFVCYSLCKLKKIPTVIVCQAHIPDTCLVFDDWEKTDYGLTKALEQLKHRYQAESNNKIELSPRFESYYKLQTSETVDVTPFYEKKKPLHVRVAKKTSSIFNKIRKDPNFYLKEFPIIARSLIRRSAASLKTKILMNYYESKCTDFDPRKRYIFVALHVQPEMSTSPRADAFVEQKMIIELLSSCVPNDIKIFVKEHPSQNSLSRSRKYYDNILGCKNVELISRKIGSKKLVQNSLAVSTCVGLAGFESLFQGKPVLMFGHDFFQSAPGVFSIRTKEDLDLAIKEIAKGRIFNQKDFRLFLKALETVAVYGTIDSDYMPTSTIKNDENTNNIAEKILAEYKKARKND